VTAPDGIRRSFTGEGDWRMLPLVAASRELAAVLPLAAVLSAVENEGVRRCLFKYDVDESDRGSAGRCEVTGERGLEST
jgi:hypothetical protein